MADDVIKDIRDLLTDIKPALQRDCAVGTPEATARAAALRRLEAVRSELGRIRQHLTEWAPGPSETKQGG